VQTRILTEKKTISILVPCYNEEDVLHEFYNRTVAVIDEIYDYNFQFVFVNDGSKDHTIDIMRELREKDTRVCYIDLSRNFGKEIAMIAGIDYLIGNAAIIMDADLQDPPEMIPEMISYWEQGYNDVCAKRRSRAGESFLKKWSSHMFYCVLQKVSNISIQTDVGDFRLLDRQCLESLRIMRESQRYTKGLFSWIGFEKKEILFDRDARIAGKTKWNYWKLINLAIEGLTSFTIAPLRLASFVGCFLALVAMIYMVYVIIKTLLYGGDVAGYPSLITVVLFIGGVQLFFMGIMGEYIGRIFNESKFRPLYLVKDYNGERVIKQNR
jgi:glycosyltransferase involved in cell wall biosynthesis